MEGEETCHRGEEWRRPKQAGAGPRTEERGSEDGGGEGEGASGPEWMRQGERAARVEGAGEENERRRQEDAAVGERPRPGEHSRRGWVGERDEGETRQTGNAERKREARGRSGVGGAQHRSGIRATGGEAGKPRGWKRDAGGGLDGGARRRAG